MRTLVRNTSDEQSRAFWDSAAPPLVRAIHIGSISRSFALSSSSATSEALFPKRPVAASTSKVSATHGVVEILTVSVWTEFRRLDITGPYLGTVLA